MGPNWLSFSFAVLLSSIFPQTLKAQCSDTGNTTCVTSFNRTCFAEDICAACLDGYISFKNDTSCFAIDDIDWETFIQLFNPTYKGSDLTQEERLQLLIAIAKFISEHNAANSSDFELEINRFSADSPEDAQDRTGYMYIKGSEDDLEDDFSAEVFTANTTLPERVNWVEEGAVTSVKDQGRCGCCWAISLAGAIESVAAINSNFTYLQSTSFQQFISCDPTNYGCDGGNIVTGMVYAMSWKGGMSSLNDYPFTDEKGETTGECYDKPVSVDPDDGKIVITFSDGRSFSERFERMKYAVTLQPVSMVLKTQCDLFSSYKSGVMTDDGDCRCEDVSCIDHAVLLVGYDDTYDPPYWLLKNSWGTSWGEGGYFRIAQASYEREWGLFGILGQGVIPLKAQNLTEQVDDEPQTTSGITWWEILVIAIVGVLVLLGCCCVASKCFRNQK